MSEEAHNEHSVTEVYTYQTHYVIHLETFVLSLNSLFAIRNALILHGRNTQDGSYPLA